MSLALAKPNLEIVKFDSPVLCSPEEQRELLEVMQANLSEDVPVDFPRIKIPSGGGLTFEIPGEEESEPVKELVGIILDHYRVNAYWADEYAGAGAPPTCSALDGKHGVGKPGGNCDTCHLNAWGSSTKGGRGKACKNIRRVYLLVEGEMLPYLLALPPTSLDDFNTYMRRLTSKHKVPYYGAISKAKLYKTTNKDGIAYSAVAWSFVGALSAQDRNAMKTYAQNLKSAMRNATIEFTDYAAENGDAVTVNAAATTVDDGEPF
jgi:hypothetical protein